MGKGAAIRLAEAGANLAIIDLNKESGQQMVEELSKKHGQQKFLVRQLLSSISRDNIYYPILTMPLQFKAVDVTDATAVEEAVDAVAKEFGSITGLVCSAGSKRFTQKGAKAILQQSLIALLRQSLFPLLAFTK